MISQLERLRTWVKDARDLCRAILDCESELDENGDMYLKVPAKSITDLGALIRHFLENTEDPPSSELRWNLQVSRGGHQTAVGVGPEGNELFYVVGMEDEWEAVIRRQDYASSESIPAKFPTLDRAKFICEALHQEADINHHYDKKEPPL